MGERKEKGCGRSIRGQTSKVASIPSTILYLELILSLGVVTYKFIRRATAFLFEKGRSIIPM
jgi:hypothetical protein